MYICLSHKLFLVIKQSFLSSTFSSIQVPIQALKLKGKTVFIVLCIDRYLACKKNGVIFKQDEVDAYFNSWKISLKATTKLFEFIKGMEPHETKKTLSVNEARNFIIAMSKPMAEAVELIDRNSKEIEKLKNEWRGDEDEIQKVQEKLRFKGLKRKRKYLDHAITVCTHQDCREYKLIGKSKRQETIYSQICHDPCRLKGIPSETTNNVQLYYCHAMAYGKCKRCRHEYRDHMHLTYTTSLEEATFFSDAVQKEINDLTGVKEKKQKIIDKLKKRIEELQGEKKILYRCASHFGAFLKTNAMIPYNDSFSDYHDMLIKEEQAKENRDKARITQLIKDKGAYEMKKEAIIKSSPAHSKEIQIEKMYEIRNQLCSLKHNGEDLKEALGTVNFSKQ